MVTEIYYSGSNWKLKQSGIILSLTWYKNFYDHLKAAMKTNYWNLLNSMGLCTMAVVSFE